MKKFLRTLSGKNKAADAEPGPHTALELGVPQPPPAYAPQQRPVVVNGSMRRPRRPRETVDLQYRDLAPFAPHQPPPAPAPAAKRQLELDMELARQLAQQEAAAAAAAAAVQLPPPPPPPAPQPQQTEAAFQAELEAAVAESVVQADYDNVLRDIKLWIMDLEGALGELAEAQRAAARRRAEIDARLAAAHPGDEEGLREARWLSEVHTEVEAKLQGLGWRLKPIHDAVDALRALDAYIRADQPPVPEAREALDRIIARLIEELNVMGFAFHHPIAPFGRQPGEGSSRDLGGRGATDPLRELVHSLIQETQRTPPPPLPVPVAPPAPPAVEQEPAPAEEPEVESEPELAPPPEPAAEPSLPELPATPEPSKEPELLPAAAVEAPLLDLPSPSPPPSSAAGSEPAGSEEGEWESSDGGARSAGGGRVRRHRSGASAGSGGGRLHRHRSGHRPEREDSIRRLPRVVALYHELQKGVVAEAVGWNLSKPGADGGRAAARAAASKPTGYPGAVAPGRGAAPATKFRPAMYPTRLPPSSSRGRGTAQEAGAAQEAGSSAVAEPAAAASTPSTAELASLAGGIAACQPESMQQAAEMVAELRARGAAGAAAAPAEQRAAAGWPQERWATLAEAADVHNSLLDMADALSNWQVDVQAGIEAESRRLAAFIDKASKEAGRVTYPHDPLRVRMAKHGVPWDPSLLVELRWGAQVAAAALMAAALDQARELSKAKKWQASAALQPLGHAALGAFKVHQFCGGLSGACTLLFDQIQELTIHYARMMDPQWLRNTKFA